MKIAYISANGAVNNDVAWDEVVDTLNYSPDPDTLYFYGKVSQDFVGLCKSQIKALGAYGLKGTWLDIGTSGSLETVSKCVQFNRIPGAQRYARLDEGLKQVHLLEALPLCLYRIPTIEKIADPILFSQELEKRELPRYVLESNFWRGPRLNFHRYSPFSNLAAGMMKLAKSTWTPIDLNQPVIFEDVPDEQQPDEPGQEKPNPLPNTLVDYQLEDPMWIMAVITTHNRTATALATIESLVKHLKYPRLKWCLCDDRSEPGHVAKLMDKFAELGVEDVKVCRTTEEHWGLGASLNNGLKAAFDLAPVVFTTEDDWMLEQDLDLTEWVTFLNTHVEAAVVRLGMLNLKTGNARLEKETKTLSRVTWPKNHQFGWLITNQVALRHRRLYDALGLYMENVHSDVAEQEFNMRHRRYLGDYTKDMLRVYWPTKFPTGTLRSPKLPFYHFGHSTVEHGYDSGKYAEIANQDQ